MAPTVSAPAAMPKPIPGPHPQPRPQRASAGEETAAVPTAATVAKISAVLFMTHSFFSMVGITLLQTACCLGRRGAALGGSATPAWGSVGWGGLQLTLSATRHLLRDAFFG